MHRRTLVPIRNPVAGVDDPASLATDTGWGNFLDGILRKGVSRVVDAELDERYSVNQNAQNFTDEQTGQVFRSGQPATPASTPMATPIAMPQNRTLIIGGAAVIGLVVLLLVLRK
jgi:hypothetical protein